MSKVHTHYDNLKVTRSAPSEVIKAAYRAMAQKYHPDVNPAPDAARVMRLVNEAWSVLSDPELRAEHDQWIARQESTVKPEPSTAPAGKQKHWSGKSQSNDKNRGSGYSEKSTYAQQHKSRTESKTWADEGTIYGGQSNLSEGYKVSSSFFGRFFQELPPIFRKNTVIVFLVLIGLGIGYLVASAESGKIRDRDFTHKNNSAAKQFTERPKPEALKPLNFYPSDTPTSTSPSTEKKFTFIPEEPRRANGYIKADKQIFGGGSSTFEIDNRSGSHDAEVRLYLNGQKVRSMYVRVGTAFTADRLGPGTYRMKYRMNVEGVARVYQAKDDFVLRQTVTNTEEGTLTRFSRVTVTLYAVRDGNMQTEEIPSSNF